MEYKSQNVVCQNCKASFAIEPEDFNFYEKIKVPPPSFCPECRLVRRITWRNERSLYKRLCAKTGKEIITMFHPDTDVVVYDHDVWWGDGWEPTDYRQEYNFSRPFFEQFQELLHKTPLANLGNVNCVGSPYGNHNLDCKYCYLLYASYDNERTHYSSGAVGLKDCLDIYVVEKSELSYWDMLCAGLYKTHFSYDTDESIDSFFLKHGKNLQDCIGCVKVRNKSHCILNIQYTKEEYETKKEELDFGSYKKLCEFLNLYNKFTPNFPNKYANIIKSTRCTGDNIMNSKNSKRCFDVYGDTEDSKYAIHCIDLKDSYDMYGGGIASLMYESVDAGVQSSKQLFSIFTHSCLETHYTYMCFNSKNIFGCVGLRSKQYCILNKQYSKEEYENLKNKIIADMKKREEYGKFLPYIMSAGPFNFSTSFLYFPKTKRENILKLGGYWEDVDESNIEGMLTSELPDDVKDVPDTIFTKALICPETGWRFNIAQNELIFYKENNIPLPRYHFDVRTKEQLKYLTVLHPYLYKCFYCQKDINAYYPPEWGYEKIACEECYKQNIA